MVWICLSLTQTRTFFSNGILQQHLKYSILIISPSITHFYAECCGGGNRKEEKKKNEAAQILWTFIIFASLGV